MQFYMPEITENRLWTIVCKKTEILTLMVPVALKLPLWDGPPDFSWPLGTQEQQKIEGTWFAHLVMFFSVKIEKNSNFFAFFEVFGEF